MNFEALLPGVRGGYALLVAIAWLLTFEFRRDRAATALAATAAFIAFALIYAGVAPDFFYDFQAYVRWLATAQQKLSEHLDKGFGLLMIALGAVSTDAWVMLVFVPTTIAALAAAAARNAGARLPVVFLLLFTNPRVHEFCFNSTRAALCIGLLAWAVTLLPRRRMLALAVALAAVSIHVVIGTATLAVILIGWLLPLRLLMAAFAVASLMAVSGVYPESIYAWPRANLTELVLLTKGDAIDEYLTESLEGSTWARFSIWFFCAGITAYMLVQHLRRRQHDATEDLLLRIAAAAGTAALLFASLVPMAARLHLLGLLFASLAFARENDRPNSRFWMATAVLAGGLLSVWKNDVFLILH